MERSLAQDVPIGATQVSLAQLNERSRDIFRQIVESYLATGDPVGSRNISRLITTPLSPASVRNVMSDLEQLGLVYAPHTSAGRLPTELGLRFFVDALMEIGDLGEADRRDMEAKVAAAGLASWSGGETDERKLIVRGAAHLLDDLKAVEDLERVRLLFDDLEAKRGVVDLLGRAERADGARIFIGSENKLFSLSGSSTIVAPYRDGAGRIVGVIGVIGPPRLNYAPVIPMVDYTAKVVSKLIGG